MKIIISLTPNEMKKTTEVVNDANDMINYDVIGNEYIHEGKIFANRAHSLKSVDFAQNEGIIQIDIAEKFSTWVLEKAKGLIKFIRPMMPYFSRAVEEIAEFVAPIYTFEEICSSGKIGAFKKIDGSNKYEQASYMGRLDDLKLFKETDEDCIYISDDKSIILVCKSINAK